MFLSGIQSSTGFPPKACGNDSLYKITICEPLQYTKNESMKAKALMILGTSSGVGKSVIAAGFCRLFSDWGFRVAPFKAQNMSNNSWVTDEGGEMGRAQVVQAQCARVRPHTDMNPVLLKPAADNGSQVVVHGRAIGHFNARDYFAQKEKIADAIRESYERLTARYEILVIEGAGSPAEVNLKQNDLVNMKMAELADAKCVLVGDIDRGGIFASLLGTLDLLAPEERARIAGLLVNKFRGDETLFHDGIEFLERRSGKKVWGVLPFDRSLWLEEEDAVSVEGVILNPSRCHPERDSAQGQAPRRISQQTGILRPCIGGRPDAGTQDDTFLDIAVILLPRLSNFTDFEILKQEPGVRLRYLRRPAQLGSPDLLILPGTKATVADLEVLESQGWREPVARFAGRGGNLLGICGGYQMLGERIVDRDGIESARKEVRGFGFLNMTTEFFPEKILGRVSDDLNLPLFGATVSGKVQAYEIRMGRTTHHEAYAPFGREGAVHPSGRIAGTYYHGLFESAEFRESFLNALALSSRRSFPRHRRFAQVPQANGERKRESSENFGSPITAFGDDNTSVSFESLKEANYSRLAALMSRRLNLELVLESLGISGSLIPKNFVKNGALELNSNLT